jgi:hypothetical protein
MGSELTAAANQTTAASQSNQYRVNASPILQSAFKHAFNCTEVRKKGKSETLTVDIVVCQHISLIETAKL